MPGHIFCPTTKVKDFYSCPHCRLILRDAVQTGDGHRLCRDCCEEIRTQGALCWIETGTNNGEYIWKIPNVHRQYRDAVERNKCIFSPPFYTGPHGYKMCMRVYLNGDGIGKGTHVSLFFSIMCSNHDDFLCWPFKQLVQLSLSTQTASITKVFRPDPASSSFQKPVMDMNIASGCPKFACQPVLHNRSFAADDIMHFKCRVDLTGL